MFEKMIKVKNYEPGFEQDLIRIHNLVIKELHPSSLPITLEKVLKRHQDSSFIPEQVKFLLNDKNEIIGYNEVRIYRDSHLIFYPHILPEYCTPEIIDVLFKEIYNFSLSLKPRIIQSVYRFGFKKANEYFKNQRIAPILASYSRPELEIDVSQLSHIKSKYSIKAIEKEDFPKITKFLAISNADTPIRRLNEKSLEFLFEKKFIGSESSFIIFEKTDIRALVFASKFESEGEKKDYQGMMQEAIDINLNNDIEIRKALLQASLTFLHSNDLKKMILFTLNPSFGYNTYKKLGFKENGYGRTIFCFNSGNNLSETPFYNR
jgi:hypothetical protein